MGLILLRAFALGTEEKLDEFLQQLSYSDSPNYSGRRYSPLSAARQQDDSSFYYVLQELSALIASGGTEANGTGTTAAAAATCGSPDDSQISREADRLMWGASASLGDSRPPSNLCIYDRSGATAPLEGQENNPPIFDGSVANSTPAPLGGTAAGASGGSGTALHLACALDRPLTLAFLLIMGADGRASHTAFRRLVIHEAACNGSINCLRLLLEMGYKFATKGGSEKTDSSSAVPFLPDAMELSSSSSVMHGPLISARVPPPIAMNFRHFRRGAGGSFSRSTSVRKSNHGGSDSQHEYHSKHADFLSMLRQYQNCCALVRNGEISELQAARSLLAHAPLLETTRNALVRTCTFQNDAYVTHSFLRPYGCADGHGNTPLHWAAFKNETECVRLLLRYNADPNARAHPSGWTPLHDAAYSNSSECIELLVSKGAHVDARANSGATPLCFAAQEDAADAAKFLLEHGADLSARCAGGQQEDATQQPLQMPGHPHSRFSGYTPLHYCAHHNAQMASRVLLAHSKARVAMETPDLSGRLPIHVAVARGSSDVLRALLHAGARVDILPSNSTRTPSSLSVLFGQLPDAPTHRRPPIPEEPGTPNRSGSSSSSTNSSPVTSPLLRSMIPSQPINSSKPWNCLSQQAIDECKELISKAEQSWTPEHHLLFTPQDRKAVMELLRVGKRLEQNGTGIFVDLWPQVLGFCGRGWFETEDSKLLSVANGGQSDEESDGLGDGSDTEDSATSDDDDYLALPSFR